MSKKKLYEYSVGRPKKYKTPKQLWDKAVEYFKWCEDNPIPVNDVVRGGDSAGQLISSEKIRAFTWDGLDVFCNAIGGLKRYREGQYPEFVPIIARIDKIMWEQKFTGAAAGELSHNIIARELGLVDKKEETGDLNINITRKVIKGGK